MFLFLDVGVEYVLFLDVSGNAHFFYVDESSLEYNPAQSS